MPPLVSVIIPIFNGKRFLGEALDSVFAQSNPHLEVIAVDDGSNDGSAEIVERYKEIQYFRQENQGGASARNFGISKAQGKFLTFLDQDDLWTPKKLRVQLEFFSRNPGVDYVMAHERLLIEPGSPPPIWIKQEYWHQAHPGFHFGTLMVRRTFFAKVGSFSTEYRYCSDTEWMIRAKAFAPWIFLPEVLLLKRVHRDSVSNQQAAMQRETIRLFRGELVRKLKERKQKKTDSENTKLEH